MNLISDSRYERDTDLLNTLQTKIQIQRLFQISETIQKNQFSQALKLIQDFKIIKSSNKDNIQQDAPIVIQIKFQQILLKAAMAKSQKTFLATIKKLYLQILALFKIVQNISQEYYQHEKQRWEEGQDFQIKIFTTILQFSVENDEIDSTQWVQKLIIKLKMYPQRRKEVVGKLTGCKDLVSFAQNFNLQVILKSSTNKALMGQKLDILTTWLLFAGKHLQAIQCKQKALQFWKNSNSLKQYNKCLDELSDIKGKQKISKLNYMKKIKLIRAIVRKIINQVHLIPQKQSNLHLIMKKSLVLSMRNLQFQQIQVSKKSNIKQSSLKLSTNSKLKFESYRSRCADFYESVYVMERGNQITDLLYKSKFLFHQQKLFKQTIAPIDSLVKLRYRYFFNIIKLNYLVKGVVAQVSLKKKNSNNEYKNLKLQKKVSNISNQPKQFKNEQKQFKNQQKQFKNQQKLSKSEFKQSKKPNKSGNKLIQKGLNQFSQQQSLQQKNDAELKLIKIYKDEQKKIDQSD